MSLHRFVPRQDIRCIPSCIYIFLYYFLVHCVLVWVAGFSSCVLDNMSSSSLHSLLKCDDLPKVMFRCFDLQACLLSSSFSFLSLKWHTRTSLWNQNIVLMKSRHPVSVTLVLIFSLSVIWSYYHVLSPSEQWTPVLFQECWAVFDKILEVKAYVFFYYSSWK